MMVLCALEGGLLCVCGASRGDLDAVLRAITVEIL